MKWNIVTDSSCEYSGKTTKDLGFQKVPFIITIDDKSYIDDESLCTSELVDAMEKSENVSRTACPSPGAWYDCFLQAEQTIAITISSGVSGSYGSAMVARDMVLEQYPSKKIFVLDSLSAGSALSLFSRKAEFLIQEGYDFETVVKQLQLYRSMTKTVFALSSFENLIKNGRMNRVVGILAGKLGIWGIGGASSEGKIISKCKIRGTQRMLQTILEDMEKNEYHCSRVAITHCQNPELAEALKKKIIERWEDAPVDILPAAGLCSFYAEKGGLIVAY